MSTLFVDTINEKTTNNGVYIPGHVIQVVTSTTSTEASATTTSYVDTGLSASITPASTSSKILVLVNQAVYSFATTFNAIGGVRLMRGSTAILSPFADGTGPLEPYLEVTNSTGIYNSLRHPITFLDSPSTTSATTYKTQGRIRMTGSSRTVKFQSAGSGGNGTSTITLMEIGG